jgi:tRNA(Ile)-lysidine synthase
MSAEHGRFEPASIAPLLRACGSSCRLLVAMSGGLDSSVLLHAVASLRPSLTPGRVRAVHIEHGLHPEAPYWAQRCVKQAAALDIACEIRRVQVPVGRSASPEAAAREARYDALARELEDDEVLLTAHHADDQLETVLLALMRGSGVAGLAAMPERAPFARGWHVRPLLPFVRAALARYAQEAGIEYCEDPSNLDRRFARNFLRAEVVPRLTQRWPAASRTVGRSAALAGEAARLIDELAAIDLAACERAGRLDVRVLATLSPARARNALRAWIRRAGLLAPSLRMLEQIVSDVVPARHDAQPRLAWSGAELRRRGEWLHLMEPLPSAPAERIPLVVDRAVGLGKLGELRLEPCTGSGLSAAALHGHELSLGFRRGGERIRPAGDAHRRSLKKLLQTHEVVPWMRGRIPLVYADEELAAVADLWTSNDYAARADERSYRVRWLHHPGLR